MPETKLYTKKPIPVQAYRWAGAFQVGGPVQPLEDHWHHGGENKELDDPCKHCGIRYAKHAWIEALEGGHIACPGDYIIKGVRGDHYPMKPDTFHETYKEVKG